MDMSAACGYWSVQSPIGRRNKKSGAKKRKQTDIELSRLQEQWESVDAQEG